VLGLAPASIYPNGSLWSISVHPHTRGSLRQRDHASEHWIRFVARHHGRTTSKCGESSVAASSKPAARSVPQLATQMLLDVEAVETAAYHVDRVVGWFFVA
jgi:hypothetical protein